MIVVDANVVAYWAIEGEFTNSARELWRVDSEWMVPMLCRHELANVVATYVKRGAMEVADVADLWSGIELVISGNEIEVDLPSAVAIAIERKLSAYDAQYLLLAEQHGVPLVSQDKKLVKQTNFGFSISEYLLR